MMYFQPSVRTHMDVKKTIAQTQFQAIIAGCNKFKKVKFPQVSCQLSQWGKDLNKDRREPCRGGEKSEGRSTKADLAKSAFLADSR